MSLFSDYHVEYFIHFLNELSLFWRWDKTGEELSFENIYT